MSRLKNFTFSQPQSKISHGPSKALPPVSIIQTTKVARSLPTMDLNIMKMKQTIPTTTIHVRAVPMPLQMTKMHQIFDGMDGNDVHMEGWSSDGCGRGVGGGSLYTSHVEYGGVGEGHRSLSMPPVGV
jgi:hypothetical protein